MLDLEAQVEEVRYIQARLQPQAIIVHTYTCIKNTRVTMHASKISQIGGQKWIRLFLMYLYLVIKYFISDLPIKKPNNPTCSSKYLVSFQSVNHCRKLKHTQYSFRKLCWQQQWWWSWFWRRRYGWSWWHGCLWRW